MKKLLVAIAALCIAASAHAQFGIMAGVTSSESDLKQAAANIGEVTQYHVGLAFKLNLGIIAVQPAILYNLKGATLTENVNSLTGESTGTVLDTGTKTTTNQTGFLEVPVQVQVGIPLPGVRPYAFAEPFVGYAITNESTEDFTNTAAAAIDNKGDTKTDWSNVTNRLEYGIGLGAGIDLFDTVQLSVRYFWNLGGLYNEEGKASVSATGTVDTIKEQKCNGIMASLAFFF